MRDYSTLATSAIFALVVRVQEIDIFHDFVESVWAVVGGPIRIVRGNREDAAAPSSVKVCLSICKHV